MRIIIILFLITLSIEARTQFVVDAGNDSIICCCETESYTIGGNPAASGGQQPYNYSWSGKMLLTTVPDSIYLFASEVLDDTTVSNPVVLIEKLPDEWFNFTLTVKDANGDIQRDSVKIIYSSIIKHEIFKNPVTINEGDSIQFYGHFFADINKFQPLTFKITPSYGLSDSTDVFGWAKPEKSTSYQIQATNSAGCKTLFSHYWQINVDTVSSNIEANYKSKINCYIKNYSLHVRIPQFYSEEWELTVISTNGQLIHYSKFKQNDITLNDLELGLNQIFLVSIKIGNERYIFKHRFGEL